MFRVETMFVEECVCVRWFTKYFSAQCLLCSLCMKVYCGVQKIYLYRANAVFDFYCWVMIVEDIYEVLKCAYTMCPHPYDVV